MDFVKAKKRLGQHFLKDESIAFDIVSALKAETGNVLEIGAGMGVLTQYLLAKENLNLKIIEIDNQSVEYLLQHFSALNGKVTEKDFLKTDLSHLFSQQKFSIIGNFPYNISSQILFKMLEYKDLVVELTGMFQKEVALRITSPNGSKNYGILSVLLQAYYTTEYLFDVPPDVFLPPPKVDSAVIRLLRNETTTLPCDEKVFKNIVKTSFNQRRKTLRNSLKNINFNPDFQSNTIFNLRPEQLSTDDFIQLAQNTYFSECRV
ncbi:MAG: 16S rRNA (adenine(1518)-N(6)/adenine(1519)-N(6))-dimethyltransferase RsmA [Bacteroidales bacterium]|jgi:16S rRNA (adenine1518-N6/adenine1519-N6)-dimethyltransferase|nr:16S rRNA (adenine(1518)-N(6)/adenine(1519)-N(6))-dimethyltransferase RsmA [Bacteroidales bacterium]